jgi:hypothetical protein
MLRLLFLCSFIFLVGTCGRAQNINPTYNHVIAAGGLNLRVQPNTRASVIAAIPFGDQVNVFDHCDYGRDTVGYLQDYYRVHDHGTETTQYQDQAITGNWLRVTYGKDTGFVFSAYLWYDFMLQHDDTAPEPDYIMISPGGGCGGVIYDPHAYHYYGVYEPDHGKMSLRAINISFLAVVDDFEALLITTNQPRDLRFILGSKKKLKTSSFSADYLDREARLFPLQHQGEDTIMGITIPGISFDTLQPYGYPVATNLRLNIGGQQQVIPLATQPSEVFVSGLGDFDGDGHTDYLFFYPSDQASYLNLYLSTAAGPGEIVRLAASEWFGCCC